MAREIPNVIYKVLLPVKLLRRYEALSIKFRRGLSTTLRAVLVATIDEAEAVGKKLYRFSAEEDQFDELARQVDEGVDAEGEGLSGPTAEGQAADDGVAEHPAEDPDGEGTEVGDDGGNVDDPAPEGGGEPPPPARKAGRPRKNKKGR